MCLPPYTFAIKALLEEYDNLLRCVRCAACLTSCPTYVTSHKEEEGPRGRIAIMRALAEGQLEATPDAIEHLNNCLLCEACTHVCPSGVEMERLGVAFREGLRDTSHRRRPPAERFAFGWLFGDLSHFRLLARFVRWYQRSGLQWLGRHLGIVRLLRLRRLETLLPRMPSRFVVPADEIAGKGEPVSAFAGCVMSTAFAATQETASQLLAAFGCQTSLPQGQVCCGALQFHSGDVERARRLARQNIAAFGADAAPIVVSAAGCGAMLKNYARLLADEPAASAFSSRVKDVSEFLAEREPRRPPRELPLKITLQDACHLLHAQRIADAPRRLLRAIPGVELREMAEAGICCGSAGIYNITHPAESSELQRRKCANISATGAEVVLTGNPGCLMQIQAGLPQSTKVQHIVDFLAAAYVQEDESRVMSHKSRANDLSNSAPEAKQ